MKTEAQVVAEIERLIAEGEELSTRAFSVGCWKCYVAAMSAVKLRGVLGYGRHLQGRVSELVEAVQILREAMLILRMPLSSEHVDALDRIVGYHHAEG